MFNRAFSHYLSYGATDQETARELRGAYDGLLVPGTVAALQMEGTRGFVLTLSADQRIEYAIDPRFPLFQQSLPQAKSSHIALAGVFGDPTLVQRSKAPTPDDFNANRIRALASEWAGFNKGYTKLKDEHFQKYARRLGEDQQPKRVRLPICIVAPYFVANDVGDPWWAVSRSLSEATKDAAADIQVVTVIATERPEALAELGIAAGERDLAIWVSRLDELDASSLGALRLIEYGRSINRLAAAKIRTFALYGGFFSVLLHAEGLRGASHGIGYGESRAWQELPVSGPPPSRYYLPLAHRYVSQDLAAVLWNLAPDLVECLCRICERGNPGSLSYQSLMKHSVYCRQAEIAEWTPLSRGEQADRLQDAARRFTQAAYELDVPRPMQRQAENSYAHLPMWRAVLTELGSESN